MNSRNRLAQMTSANPLKMLICISAGACLCRCRLVEAVGLLFESMHLSLGAGINFDDLAFKKNGNDRQLFAGNGDALSFTNWYSDPTSHSFVNLQMIQEASGTYDPNGSNRLRDNKIETFSFSVLVNSFDQARVANPRLNRWNLMNGALNAHLGGSNDAALGGDLAYQYGMAGDLTSMGIDAAQALLANAQLNTSAQRLQSVASLGVGQQRLS